MATQSVLIVDDEPDIRELLDITLSRMGLQTHSAATLEEAKELIARVQPDLCLTDMRLPDGNGISLVAIYSTGIPSHSRCYDYRPRQRRNSHLRSQSRGLRFYQQAC